AQPDGTERMLATGTLCKGSLESRVLPPSAALAPALAQNRSKQRQVEASRDKTISPGASLTGAYQLAPSGLFDRVKPLPTTPVNSSCLMEDRGLEPLTSCMPCKRSPS